MFSIFTSFIKKIMTKFIANQSRGSNAGSIVLTEGMSEAITLWSRLYVNKAPWLKELGISSLNIPSVISSELARLVTIESQSFISGSIRGEYLNNEYQVFINSLRRFVEYACAEGGMVFKPYVFGTKIFIDAVRAERFFPVSFNGGGEITAAAFIDRLVKNGAVFTKIEFHNRSADVYTIINTAYMSGSLSSIGEEIPLERVPEWKDLAPIVTLYDVAFPLFGYFKIPMANTIDPDSPLGVSVYSRAVDLIRQADEHWDKILWEYKATETAVDASDDLFVRDQRGGIILPSGSERLYRHYNIPSPDGSRPFIETFSPEIRAEPLFRGLMEIFRRIEFNCGLSYGILSDANQKELTATEILSSKQRLYSTVTDIQKSLQTSLSQCVKAMDFLATLYSLSPLGEYSLLFSWDDSILETKAERRSNALIEYQNGIIDQAEYFMRVEGLSEEAALEKTAKISSRKVPEPPFSFFNETA